MPASPDAARRGQALERIRNQEGVRSFLRAAVEEDRIDHAYLFVGVPGSGKNEAALALASCIVCPNGGDGDCDECIRVAHRTHPDVHIVEPAGVSGYLVSQIHELIEDVHLTPVRGRAKVYLLTRADLLRSAAANALLKTIEEPPPAVYFILIARSADACLPTVVSRCQQIPFREVPPEEAAAELSTRTGAGQAMVRVALAVAGTPERAEEWLASSDRREDRNRARMKHSQASRVSGGLRLALACSAARRSGPMRPTTLVVISSWMAKMSSRSRS